MERERFVDESWKESAAQEKEKLAGMTQKGPARQPQDDTGRKAKEEAASFPSDEESAAPGAADTATEGASEADFTNYVAGLGFQAMIFLGEVPNPVTQETEKNLPQAKWIIDILILLQEKTRGNLTKRESDLLNTTAYQLQMHYVEAVEKEQKGQA